MSIDNLLANGNSDRRLAHDRVFAYDNPVEVPRYGFTPGESGLGGELIKLAPEILDGGIMVHTKTGDIVFFPDRQSYAFAKSRTSAIREDHVLVGVDQEVDTADPINNETVAQLLAQVATLTKQVQALSKSKE